MGEGKLFLNRTSELKEFFEKGSGIFDITRQSERRSKHEKKILGCEHATHSILGHAIFHW
jgi:hypothetical protein